MKSKNCKEKNIKRVIVQVVLNIVIVVLLFMILYPLALGLWNAFKSKDQYVYSQFYPTLPLYFVNLKTAFVATWRFLWNTIVVAVPSIAGGVFFSTLGAYSFAKMEWPGRRICYA